MPEFFNPGPIAHPDVPVYVAAVNPYLARLAGELCEGIFPHPICTPRYLREVVLPAVAAGVRRAGRDPGAVKVLVSPMVATGRDRAEVERKTRYLKQRLGFYASTRLYHAPLALHGFLDLGQRLFALSMQGQWRAMIDLIGDDVLETFATVGTFDEVGPRLRERWGAVADTIHLDLPPELREDDRLVRSLLDALH
jgi:probable F420-dependent oxidoreductase